MRVFSKWLACLLMAACLTLFVGCGKDDDKESDGFPQGGNLTKGGNGANTAVTSANLDEFIVALFSAFNQDRDVSRGKRAILDYTIYGNNSGYVTLFSEYSMEETNEFPTKGSSTFKFFDYSNDGLLFIGGALGSSVEVETGIVTGKMNGEIKFQGKFKGKVVYDKLEVTVNIDLNTTNIKKGDLYIESNGAKINLPYESKTLLLTLLEFKV